MSNEEMIREIVGRALSETLRERSQELGADAARRMNGALAERMGKRDGNRQLRDGARSIAAAKTQTEALEALVAACSQITPACGLLVLRGTQATGWSCTGITSQENFKRAVLDCEGGVAAFVLASKAARSGKATELDGPFLARLGLSGTEEILLVPVLLKDRVAALVLALSGSADELAGLEVLAQTAQLTLDLQAFRKAVPPPPVSDAQRSAESYSKPAPSQQAAAQSVEQVTSSPAAASAPASVATALPGFAPAAVAVAAAANAVSAVSSQTPAPIQQDTADEETRDRARRFAKLLVEEIKLYNQAKVNEGRIRGDLYSRLREDVDKSRAAYQKRYGERVKDVDYFNQELIRILADNNPAAMGADFPG
jgi:hypothetical protein